MCFIDQNPRSEKGPAPSLFQSGPTLVQQEALFEPLATGISSQADYPGAEWHGSPNFWQGRNDFDVIAICNHIMQSSIESADGWFKNRQSEVSAHFGVARDGRVYQWVKVANSAWANGIMNHPNTGVKFIADCASKDWNPNYLTVSIEHEGNTGDEFPEPQYKATLALHRWILQTFSAISPDDQHIIGHFEIDSVNRPNCPGRGFPWQRLMTDLRLSSGQAQQQPPAPSPQPNSNGFWVVDPILPFWKQHQDLIGIALSPMLGAADHGFTWPGVFQEFDKARVEGEQQPDGSYALRVGNVNAELLALKSQQAQAQAQAQQLHPQVATDDAPAPADSTFADAAPDKAM